MIVSFGILLAVVASAASAHLMLRVGMSQVGRIGADELQEPIKLASSIVRNPLVLGALPLYAGSFLAWIMVLSRLRLSLAYPALAMTYIVIPLASMVFLHESVTASHWLGIVVVGVGVLLIFRAGLS